MPGWDARLGSQNPEEGLWIRDNNPLASAVGGNDEANSMAGAKTGR